MTVYNLNLPIYRDIMQHLFPKMEDRYYCIFLQKSLDDCKNKNYEEHPPCVEIEKFINTIDCFSLEKRPLHPPKKIKM